MAKNTCPHCGAWAQLSKFCYRCGKPIIYKTIEEGQAEFKNKRVTPSTQKNDVPVILFVAFVISMALYFIFG